MTVGPSVVRWLVIVMKSLLVTAEVRAQRFVVRAIIGAAEVRWHPQVHSGTPQSDG
jgi:hypothetical protein